MLGETLIKSEEVLRAERPMPRSSCSVTRTAASRRSAGGSTYHMEAGNRCFDENVPEETNRRLVDHVATTACVRTEHARATCSPRTPRRILLTGAPR